MKHTAADLFCLYLWFRSGRSHFFLPCWAQLNKPIFECTGVGGRVMVPCSDYWEPGHGATIRRVSWSSRLHHFQAYSFYPCACPNSPPVHSRALQNHNCCCCSSGLSLLFKSRAGFALIAINLVLTACLAKENQLFINNEKYSVGSQESHKIEWLPLGCSMRNSK